MINILQLLTISYCLLTDAICASFTCRGFLPLRFDFLFLLFIRGARWGPPVSLLTVMAAYAKQRRGEREWEWESESEKERDEHYIQCSCQIAWLITWVLAAIQLQSGSCKVASQPPASLLHHFSTAPTAQRVLEPHQMGSLDILMNFAICHGYCFHMQRLVMWQALFAYLLTIWA